MVLVNFPVAEVPPERKAAAIPDDEMICRLLQVENRAVPSALQVAQRRGFYERIEEEADARARGPPQRAPRLNSRSLRSNFLWAFFLEWF